MCGAGGRRKKQKSFRYYLLCGQTDIFLSKVINFLRTIITALQMLPKKLSHFIQKEVF